MTRRFRECQPNNTVAGAEGPRHRIHRTRAGVRALLVVVASTMTACSSQTSATPSGTSATTTRPTPTTQPPTTTSPQPSVISASDASSFIGQTKTVRFHVAYTHTDSAGTEFLDQDVDYTQGFIVTIFSSEVANFPTDPASTYDGQTIDVTGPISTYDGYTEILNPTRIQVSG